MPKKTCKVNNCAPPLKTKNFKKHINFEYPRGKFPRLCLIGNSNVGKSSLTKLILSHPRWYKGKVGKTAGSTRKLMLIHDPNQKYQTIDLPGFGHMSRLTRKAGGLVKDQILDYVEKDASNIFLMIMVISAERLDEELEKWYFKKQDTIPLSVEFIQYVLAQDIPCVCVLNKIDKVNVYQQKKIYSKLTQVLSDFSISEGGINQKEGLLKILFTSAKEKDHKGVKELRKLIHHRTRMLKMEDFDNINELYKKDHIAKRKKQK